MPVKRNDPNYNLKRIPDFMKKIDKKTNGCWEWTGSKNPTGYGVGSYKGKLMQIHRIFYILFVDEIPKGLVIDHLCKNKICVNPEHLECVTQKENLRRCGWGRNWQTKKTKCPRGHDYTIKKEKNQRIHRICKICMQFRSFKIRTNLTLADFEEKQKIENKLRAQDNCKIDEKTTSLIETFGYSTLISAIKIKLAQKDILCYQRSIVHAVKMIESSKIPIEQFATQLGVKPTYKR